MAATYITQDDVEQRFGRANVQAWADLDGEGRQSVITARIAAAMEDAEGMVNGWLRGGPYTIPFTTTTLPSCVVRATALLAGVLLYESRGIKDFNAETGDAQHRLSFQKKEAERIIQDLRRRKITVDPTVTPGTANYPQVIDNERDD